MPFAEVDNGVIYYEVIGEGRWVVLIHGAWAHHRWWQCQIQELSKKYKILALDVRGHGKSTQLEKPYSILGFIRDLDSLFQKAGVDEMILIGWSMGGIISMQYCMDHPDRVKGMVLVATRALRNPMFRWRLRFQLLQTWLNLLMDFAGYSALDYTNRLEREVSTMLAPATPKQIVDWAKEDLSKNPRKNIVQVAKSLWDWEAGERLRTIQVPTLILVGRNDRQTPPALSQYIHSRIPGSRLTILEDCGHYLILERADRVNEEILEFLGEIGY
jgi:non-heme chloroperoxidase